MNMNLKIHLTVTLYVIVTAYVHAQCDIKTSNECTCTTQSKSNMLNIVCQFSATTNNSNLWQPIILDLNNQVQANIYELDISSNGLEQVPSNIFQGIALIRKMILRNNSINDTGDIAFPAAIAKSITDLDISENHIGTIDIKKWLPKFPVLRVLNARSNNLVAVSGIGDFTNTHVLQQVDLSYNLLERFDNFLWGIAEHINLSYNKISIIHQIPDCDIQSISLKGNPLNSLASDLFINLHSLQTLILVNCSLHNLHINTFKECRSLRVLNISHNTLDALPVGLFKDLVNLVDLDISNNMLMTIQADMFNGLQNSVETLDLSQNNIQQLGSLSFEKLSELRTLVLHGNPKLQIIELIILPPHLHTLDFSDCNIEKINDCYFYSLKDLTWLALNGNNLDCSCPVIWLHTFIRHRSKSRQDTSHALDTWTCKLENGNTTMVHLLNTLCPVLEPHTIPEHCRTAENETNIGDIDLQISSENKEIVFKWTAENITWIHGYRVIIKTEGGELFRSPVLHPETREYRVKGIEPSSDYSACLEVLDEERQVLHEECRNKPYHSFQAIVGILAGIIFLVPCIVVLVYIVVKDRQKRKAEEYARLESGDSVESEQSSQVKIVIDDSSMNGTIEGNVKPMSSLKPDTQKTINNDTQSGNDNKAFEQNEKQSEQTVSVSFDFPKEKDKHETSNLHVTAAIVSDDSTCNTKL